jgi:hypothetical protein
VLPTSGIEGTLPAGFIQEKPPTSPYERMGTMDQLIRHALARRALRLATTTLLALTALTATPPLLRAQAGPASGNGRPQTLRIFIDSRVRGFDQNYLKTEIDFVDWVRDVRDAEVYLLITSQSAGAGGNAYRIDLMGRRPPFEAMADTLIYVSTQDETDDVTRSNIVRIIKLGLVPYLLKTEAGEQFELTRREEELRGPGVRPLLPTDDPWNFWVFSSRLSGNLRDEARSKSRDVDGSFTARRVTDALKTSLSFSGNYGENERLLSEGWYEYYTYRLNADASHVFALGPHWSAGARFTAGSSIQNNQKLSLRAAPALEWSLWPYSEFTRRQLTVQYTAGTNYYAYEDTTIYGKIRESRGNHALTVSYEMTQPWGTARASIEASHYLDHIKFYKLDFAMSWDIRLFRGFSFNVNGSASRVHDQLYISGEGYSDEDILLRIRSLQTSYRYQLRVGFSYTFGSIYSAFVNPRLNVRRDNRDFMGGY